MVFRAGQNEYGTARSRTLSRSPVLGDVSFAIFDDSSAVHAGIPRTGLVPEYAETDKNNGNEQRVTLSHFRISRAVWPPLMSANAFVSAERSQSHERDLPPRFRLNRLSREPNLPANPRLVAHGELAEAAELQRESVRF